MHHCGVLSMHVPPRPCRCVVTKSSYTQDEDFSAADRVFDCIGEAGEARFSLPDLCELLAQPAQAQ
jgi:hypothetical protein